jgi:hypothetical protein
VELPARGHFPDLEAQDDFVRLTLAGSA